VSKNQRLEDGCLNRCEQQKLDKHAGRTQPLNDALIINPFVLVRVPAKRQYSFAHDSLLIVSKRIEMELTKHAGALSLSEQNELLSENIRLKEGIKKFIDAWDNRKAYSKAFEELESLVHTNGANPETAKNEDAQT